MRIWVDPQKLVGSNLSMSDVNQVIAQQNVLISGENMGGAPALASQRTTATVIANGQLSHGRRLRRHLVLRANTDGFGGARARRRACRNRRG